MSTRLLVLGLDGASWELTQRLAQEGCMPVLARLMAEGTAGPLASTIPAISSTAWASFMTGKDPGEHGLFGFGRKPLGSYYLQPFSSISRVCGQTLWGLLSHYGQRVAVLNVPVTYPPEPVNGLLISGFGAPSGERASTYPAELAAELQTHVGPHIHDLPWAEYESRGLGPLLADARTMTRRRADYGLHCLDNGEWDFFMLVFVSTDRLQHVFWRWLDPVQPLSGKGLHWRQQILDFYTFLDSILGEFVSRAQNVVIHSDHGFGHFEAAVYLNSWLAQEGYLRWASRTPYIRYGLARLSKRFGFTTARLRQFLEKVRLDPDRQLERLSAGPKKIDWKHTRAFSFTQQGIYFNVRGREQQGTVDAGPEAERLRAELTERLQDLRDPASGKRLIHEVARPEEIYQGSMLSHAPDLVIVDYDRRYTLRPNFSPRGIFERSHWCTGDHRTDGILIACGPRIASGHHLRDARLIDLFPTILTLLDQPVPEDVHGRVLTEIFRLLPIVQSAPRTSTAEKWPPPDTLSAEEEELVFQRLKELGYLE